MNTQINYLYRDASNYKVYNECVIEGEITDEQIMTIIGCLEDGEYFIPEQVGLDANRFSDFTDDDHCLMELCKQDFSHTDKKPTVNLNCEQLVRNFEDAKGNWNYLIFAY